MLFLILLSGIVVLALISYYIFFLGPKLDPKNKAEEFLELKRYDDAILSYKKILEKKPNDPSILFKLSDVYLAIGEVDQAALCLESILENQIFTYEIDKLAVQKQLGKIYYARDEIEKTFELYANVVQMYPGDSEALYHLAFIALGQEEYGVAQRYFDKLLKNSDLGFDVYFGAGICSYQNQKINECVEYFKKALDLQPNSQIATLATSFAYWRKREYPKAYVYAEKMEPLSDSMEVTYIAKRLCAFLLLLLKKDDSAFKKYEELIEFTKESQMDEEYLLTLYDIGFAAVKSDKIKRAEHFWKLLSKEKRNFRNIQNLIMTLQREMEGADSSVFDDSIYDDMEHWLHTYFPENFLWNICNIKSEYVFDIKKYSTINRVKTESTGTSFTSEAGAIAKGGNNMESFIALDNENFRIIANRLVQKLGYRVDEILSTYKDPDGVDFMGVDKNTNEKTMVAVRRWKSMKVGSIPLRNFAQTVNEMKAQRGLFVTTAELNEGAVSSLASLTKVEVVLPEDVEKELGGLL